MTDEEIDVHHHVAVCPVTGDLVDQITALADIWGDEEATDAAMIDFGWREPGDDDIVPLDEVYHITGQGHFIIIGYSLFMPFSFYYTVGGELSPDDPFAPIPGWSVQKDAERSDFEAAVKNAVERFTSRLGKPDHTTTSKGWSALSIDHPMWSYAAWRRDEHLIVVGPKSEAGSYHQWEEATVHIVPLEKDAPFPEGDELDRLLNDL